ncbi:putative hydro-lyase [Thermanaerosceptrum fracticalcis]|uniref:Putative hydro-lyase BR63_11110 n=1 Tax=Thermanaerosceptrum fracticalcis TaxID=1712410 RepID=A0A7G6E407_THEFR|nr:putative hydro-lyase [Thermanaerosceptrum fracticalcis]QNB46811.1 putative hydro-lyase [Thermanaerosceptrum fracticalcis]
MKELQLFNAKPPEVREAIRKGELKAPTSGMCAGYAQANLVVLPQDLAFDFLLFCQRNPKPCPVLDVTDIGSYKPVLTATNADLRTDIPAYRIYEYGKLVGEVDNLLDIWRDDLVTFLLGCSFTFESGLLQGGIPVRHMEEGRNVPMYITNIQCKEAGKFRGPTVVSMRPIPYHQVIKAVQITARYPAVHGAPIHIGDPALIGIKDINKPEFGDPPIIKEGEVPVFWACGVTPQAVAMESKPPLMITHAPGHMFITDIKNEELAL